jgi:hypothetical protein
MINCTHPTHFDAVLDTDEGWPARIGGLRANASAKSHAELDEAEEPDEGDPTDLGARHAALRDKLPNLNVLGGCCGTDLDVRDPPAKVIGAMQEPIDRPVALFEFSLRTGVARTTLMSLNIRSEHAPRCPEIFRRCQTPIRV